MNQFAQRCFAFLLVSTLSLSFHPAYSAGFFSDYRVISKFSSKAEAESLVYSLRKSGQNVRIITRYEEVALKSLNVGLYSSKREADKVVKHLKANSIQAYYYKGNTGSYRVHVGSMQSEDNYWRRFEKLLALGYKHINTRLRPVTVSRFFVVRELIEAPVPASTPAPAPIISVAPDIPAAPAISVAPILAATPSVIITLKPKAFYNELLFVRFAGEFASWKEGGKQSSRNYFRTSMSARTKYKQEWDFTYGFRFDATEQSSINNTQGFEFQWLPTYLRAQESNNLIEFGLIDGRWDNRRHASLSDRLSSKNLTRYLLDDDVANRRQPIFGARWQLRHSNYQLDVIGSPIFRPAKLPASNSIWHPFNRNKKAILGIRTTANWQTLVEKGSIAKDEYQIGGIGVRLTHKIGQRTRAITLQYARRSTPYYKLNNNIQQLIANGATADAALAAIREDTFTSEYPHSASLSWGEFGNVSHFEVTATTNTPYTTSAYKMKTALSLEWMLGFIYPTKDKNVHFSSFFIGKRLNTDEDILDRKTRLGIKGEFYKQFSSQGWKIGASYQFDFDRLGLNLNPEISYEQNKHLKLSIYYQLFRGYSETDNGFYKAHSFLGLGWQADF